MHKLRNTEHIEILNSLVGIKPSGYAEPLSKKMLRKILAYCHWYKQKAIDYITSREFEYHFCDWDD